MKTAVVSCVKDERFIGNFIDYYINLGFDKIILGNNGLTDIQLSIVNKKDKVELIDCLGRSLFQYDFYNEVIDQTDYDWYLIVDGDEYLYINYDSIDKEINRFPSDCGCVFYNWMQFGSELITIDSLDQCIPYLDVTNQCHGKILVKHAAVDKITTPHDCNLKSNYYKYHSNLSIYKSEDELLDKGICDYRYGCIKHYFFQGIEGYMNKIHRGFPNALDSRKFKDITYLVEFIISNKSRLIDVSKLNITEKFNINQFTKEYKSNEFIDCYLAIINNKVKKVIFTGSIELFNKLKILGFIYNKLVLYES